MAWTVITANRLREGDVVYLTEGAGWTERLPEAYAVQTPEEEQALLAAAELEVARQRVVGPYAMPVESSAEPACARSAGARRSAPKAAPVCCQTPISASSRGVDAHVPV